MQHKLRIERKKVNWEIKTENCMKKTQNCEILRIERKSELPDIISEKKKLRITRFHNVNSEIARFGEVNTGLLQKICKLRIARKTSELQNENMQLIILQFAIARYKLSILRKSGRIVTKSHNYTF